MALNVQVGTITQPGSTGNQTTNLPADFDPKAIIMWTVGRASGAGGSAHARFCHGFATYRGSVIQQRHNGTTAEDNIGTADTYREGGTDALIKLMDGTTGAIDMEIDFVSFATGASSNFIVNWVNLDTTASALVNYIVLGGSDLEDALAATFTTQTTPATQDVTVVSGFGQPSLVLFQRISTTMDGAQRAHGEVCLGFGIKQGSTSGRGVYWGSTDAATTEATFQMVNNTKALYSGLSGAQEIDFQLSASSGWPTDGFEITYASGGQDFAEECYYLALKFSANVTLTTGEGSAPTAGGLPVVQSLTSAGTPKLLYLLNARTATANTMDSTSTDAAWVGVGACDGSGNERFAGLYDDDGQATASVAGTAESITKAIQYWLPSGNSLSSEADGQVNGSNFELSWNDIDATAFKYQWLTIGIAAAGAPGPTPPHRHSSSRALHRR